MTSPHDLLCHELLDDPSSLTLLPSFNILDAFASHQEFMLHHPQFHHNFVEFHPHPCIASCWIAHPSAVSANSSCDLTSRAQFIHPHPFSDTDSPTDFCFFENSASRSAADDDRSCTSCTTDSEIVESMAVLLHRQSWSHCRPLKSYVQRMLKESSTPGKGSSKECEWQNSRRSSVLWILRVAKLLHLKTSTAAQAVAYLDRFLSTQPFLEADLHATTHLAGVACFWIAAKMDHSTAPDIAFVQRLGSGASEESIRAMEISVLKALKWSMLGVTAADFLVTMVAWVSAYGLPRHLRKPLESRADEIMQGVLQEVEFAGYEAALVSLCIIQSVLDELVPLQAASLLSSIHKTFSIDMEDAKECYKAVGDLVVDPICRCPAPSPDRVVPATSL